MSKKMSADQLIDEASKDSFPASDAPAFVAGTDERPNLNSSAYKKDDSNAKIKNNQEVKNTSLKPKR
jgi:hypothetical protein